MGSFCSLSRNDRRTQPVLIHRRQNSPEAGLFPALYAILFSLLVPSLSSKQVSQKPNFYNEKTKASSELFRHKSGARKAAEEYFRDSR